MKAHRAVARTILALAALVMAAVAGGADVAALLASAGWDEGTPGRWNALPQRTAAVRDNTVHGEFVLAPGTGVEWEKKGSWDPVSGRALSFELTVTGTNASSQDYREHKARFPVSVTAVFGKDAEDIPFKKRLGNVFLGAWHGFSPGGIRLTYAVGSRVPVGSMYRLSAEETVFIVAGDEDKGRKIVQRRDLGADFQAAYGRAPKGPVTRLIIRAERPSGEDGPITCGVRLSLP